MSGMQYMAFFLGIMVFAALFALVDKPSTLSFINPFGLALVAGEAAGIATTCVIITGLPCAVAIVGVSAANIVTMWASSNNILNIIFYVPVMFMFTWVLIELARGN